MNVLRVMSSEHGDKPYKWDIEKVKTGNLDAISAIEEAERIFSESRRKGATAFKIEKEGNKRIDEFDPNAEQIIIVPRVIGG